MLEISNSSFRHSKAKLSEELFNRGLIAIRTCIHIYFDAKCRVIMVVLASLSRIQTTSMFAATIDASPSDHGKVEDSSMDRIQCRTDILERLADKTVEK